MNEDKMIAEINFKNGLLFIRSVSSFFYVIRSALAERCLKWTSGDHELIFDDRSALAERKSKESREKLANI